MNPGSIINNQNIPKMWIHTYSGLKIVVLCNYKKKKKKKSSYIACPVMQYH